VGTDLPVLRTSRLVIRPLEMNDLEACHQLYLNIGWEDKDASEAQNREARRRWLEWSVLNAKQLALLNQPPYGDRAVALKDGRFVGLVGLVPLLAPFRQLPSLGKIPNARYSPEVGLFWAISRSEQRKGLASEAASALIEFAWETLKLGRIMAGTDRTNVASIGVMRRLGMHIEENPFPDPHWFQVVGRLEPS
jgi:RimJ/RimL family protein N-acetyltransferase